MLDLRGALRDAREMARARGVGNLHDLTFWAGMLVEIRESRGRALEPSPGRRCDWTSERGVHALVGSTPISPFDFLREGVLYSAAYCGLAF